MITDAVVVEDQGLLLLVDGVFFVFNALLEIFAAIQLGQASVTDLLALVLVLSFVFWPARSP